MERLREMQQRIETSKSELARLEGEERSVLKRLRAEFGLSSEEDGRAELSRIEMEREELRAKILKGLQEMENKFTVAHGKDIKEPD